MTDFIVPGDDGSSAVISPGQQSNFIIQGGYKGDDGKPGNKGDTGATPNLTVGTVTTLPAGSLATATIGGTPESPVLNLGIPQGSGTVNNYSVVQERAAQAGMASSGLPSLTGAINGSNAVFTVPAGKYASDKLNVFLNGVYQPLGDSVITTTPTTGSFTMATAPQSGDQLFVLYMTDDLEDITDPGGGGVSEDFVNQRIASSLIGYVKGSDVSAAVADRQTTTQVQNTVDQRLIAFKQNEVWKLTGGNLTNYFSLTTPSGTASADWTAITRIASNAAGSLWFQPGTAAAAPSNPDNVDYDAHSDLLLAQLGYRAMNMNTENVPTDHASPETTGAGPFARAMTIAVLARDQGMYAGLRDAALNKLQRANTFSGQSTILNCFGRTYNITSNATTDWGVDAGDQLAILGAVIRAWNLWGVTKDRDLAAGIAADIKQYLVNTDEGRAYLVMDDTQKAVTNGHHNYNGTPVWANDLSKINPAIYRMVKTFTGDTVWDQLLAGFYDLVSKTQSSAGLFPHYTEYRPTDHTVAPVVNGNHGWNITLSADMDSAAMRIITHLYADYKIFTESRAGTVLKGTLLSFFKGKYDANQHIYTGYTTSGTALGTTEDANTYRTMYLLTSLSTDTSTSTAIKTNRIPYPTAVSGNNHYFNNQVKGVTAVSSREGDAANWITESMISAVYPDIALYGSNPNAGSQSTTTSTTSSGGTTTTTTTTAGTTPPPSTGVPISSWYTAGTAPNLTQTQRQTIARGEYDKFKALCFRNYNSNPDGTNQVALPDGQWRVIDNNGSTPGGVNGTVSEGIGYGMLATVFFGNPNLPTGIYDSGAQAIFNGFWKYYKSFMNSHGLMDWVIKSTGVRGDSTGGATDGDLDAAFALVMAHRMWGSAGAINYGVEAGKLINAIRDWEVVPTTGHPNPNYLCNGDQWGYDNDTYFPDYFAPGWMREFYKHTGDSRWLDIIAANYPVAQGNFYSGSSETANTNGLITDIKRSGARAGSPIFGYNDVRYPWRIAADYVWNGSNTNVLSYNQLNRMVTRAKAVYGTNPVAPPTKDSNGNDTINPYSGSSGICAEPAIDYTWWNGTYRNATYVQAYGVAGVVDSAHSAWAASCMTWLQSDNEANYFGRSLSTMATMLMAGIMQPATPTGTGSSVTPTTTQGSTTTPVVVNPPSSNLPQGKVSLYSYPNYNYAQYIATLSNGTKKDRFNWAQSVAKAYWCGIDWDPDTSGAKGVVDGAAANNLTAQVLSYSIPGRDLGQYSAGGATNRAAYEGFIKNLATSIGNRPVIMDYEPDSLPQSLSLADDQRTGRYSMMTYGIKYLKDNCPNLYLYVDIGHPAWLDTQTAANLLHQVGIENANGFCVNTSNFRPDSECINYGQQLLAALNLKGLGFVYDSGRNGGNAPDTSQWANPASRQFGKLPQFGNTGITGCDGWLWWKTPGESDGNNNDSWVGETAPNAGSFYARYLYNDDVGDNVTTGVVKTSSGMLQRPPTPGVTVSGTQNPTYP